MQTIVLPSAFAVLALGTSLTFAAADFDALLILKPNADLAFAPSAVDREKLLVKPFTMQVGPAARVAAVGAELCGARQGGVAGRLYSLGSRRNRQHALRRA
jgi:hypothetical protein